MKYLIQISGFLLVLMFLNTLLLGIGNPNPEKLTDEEFRLHISQGRIHYLRRHYRKAISQWRPLIDHKAFSDDLRNWLNKAYNKVLTAYQFYNIAYADYIKWDLPKAEKECLRSLKVYPNYQEAIELLKKIRAGMRVQTNLKTAKEHMKKNEYKKAIEISKDALKVQPDNPVATKLIEEALLKKNNVQIDQQMNELIDQGISHFSNERYIQSKKSFQNVLQINQTNFTAIKYLDDINEIQKTEKEQKIIKEETDKYYNNGVRLYKKADYTNSRSEFRNVNSLISNYKDTDKYMQKIEKKLTEKEKAEKKKNEDLIEKHLSQGITDYYEKKYKMSISHLERTLKLDPDNQFATNYIKKAKKTLFEKGEEIISEDSPYYPFFKKIEYKADYYYNQKKYLLSLKWWEKILKLFPSNKRAREMATILALKLDKKKAKEFLTIHFEIAKNFLKQKKYKNALDEFIMIEKIDPKYPDIKSHIEQVREYLKKPPVVRLPRPMLKKYYETGLSLYNQKEYENAIKEWEKILKDTSPDNPYRVNAMVNINKIKRKMTFTTDTPKKEKPSTDKYTKAAKKHYLKGVAFYIKGKYQQAINEWQIVLKYEPQHAKAKNNIEKCKRKLQFTQ